MVFFPQNGQIVPIPVNNSNSSEINKRLCENCEKIYQSLEESYKAITNSDSLEYKICADVSASVSMHDFYLECKIF